MEAITHRYNRFMVEASWDYLHPMVELTRWAAEQPFAAKLFPHTSLTSLCVGLRAGYNPDHSFFSVGFTEKGQIEFQLWEAVGKQKLSADCEIGQLNDLFKEFVGRLDVATERVSARSSWLTSDVVALAKGISHERAFDRLPILADALQDAGCDNETSWTTAASRVNTSGGVG